MTDPQITLWHILKCLHHYTGGVLAVWVCSILNYVQGLVIEKVVVPG